MTRLASQSRILDLALAQALSAQGKTDEARELFSRHGIDYVAAEPIVSAVAVLGDAPRRALTDARPCSPCGGDGYEVNDGKKCRVCKGHGRMCVSCYGHLEHDADADDQQCDDCVETSRMDGLAGAADFESDCRKDVAL